MCPGVALAVDDIGFLTRALAQVPRFRRRERWSRLQLEAYQACALRRLRAFAYARSAFYRDFHRGLLDAPLAELPVLTKRTMMERFDDLVTDPALRLRDVQAHVADEGRDPLFAGRFRVAITGGTSGQLGVAVYSEGEWARLTAASLVRSPVQGSLLRQHRTADITSPNPLHMSTQAVMTLRQWPGPELHLLATDPLPEIVEALNRFQPELLILFAATGRILAEEQAAGRLQIAPRAVVSVAEVLSAESRRRMDDVWGPVTFDAYSATECGGIATECELHQGMHVWEDLVIVENVDSQYRPVPAGAWGDRVLVTALFKRAQPLIRYELDDSVRFAAAPCPCGRPFRLIEAVQGRLQDVLRFASRGGGLVQVHPVVFHAVLDALPVGGWQVVQDGAGLHVLVTGDVDEAGVRSELLAALRAQGAELADLDVRRVAAIPQTATGKTPVVVRRTQDRAGRL